MSLRYIERSHEDRADCAANLAWGERKPESSEAKLSHATAPRRRLDGTYGFFALMMVIALLCLLAMALNHPALAGWAVCLLLLAGLLYAVLMLAGVGILSVLNDG